jgi:hypothetical protein
MIRSDVVGGVWTSIFSLCVDVSFYWLVILSIYKKTKTLNNSNIKRTKTLYNTGNLYYYIKGIQIFGMTFLIFLFYP